MWHNDNTIFGRFLKLISLSYLINLKIWNYFFNFIFKLYKIVLVLPNIKMNLPQVYMCSPSWTLLPPHTIPLGHPSALAPSIQYRASNLDWQLVSYMILYMFQCNSPKSSHPLPLPQSPKDCSINKEVFKMWWAHLGIPRTGGLEHLVKSAHTHSPLGNSFQKFRGKIDMISYPEILKGKWFKRKNELKQKH